MENSTDSTTPQRPTLEQLQKEFDGLDGLELMRAAYMRFGKRMAVQTSFGRDSAITLSMVAQIDKNIPVLFADTGMHFVDTLKYRDTLKEHFGLTNVHTLQPSVEMLAAQDPENALHKSKPTACCEIRKVTPMRDLLAQDNFDIIVTGRSKLQTSARDDLETVELHKDGIFRLNPLTHWTREQRDEALKNLPVHTLDLAYQSIGCEPCTEPVQDGQDERAGRWPEHKTISVCPLSDGNKVKHVR